MNLISFSIIQRDLVRSFRSLEKCFSSSSFVIREGKPVTYKSFSGFSTLLR